MTLGETNLHRDMNIFSPMPLAPTSPRKPIHTRTITCEAYQREDQLWDIEGHMTDHKAYAFDNAYRGRIEVGDPLHDMWLRLTLDENFVIRDVEAMTDSAPFAICPAITPAFQQLIGMKIAPGFNSRVMAMLGGVRGCTHLVDLIRPMATTAYQAMHPVLAERRSAEAKNTSPKATLNSNTNRSGTQKVKRPRLLNSCHAFDEEGDHARQLWPDYFNMREAE